MASLNRIILIGRLVSDPNARFTVDGTAITKFSLLVSRFSGAGSNAQDQIDVIAWRKVAEVCAQYLKKDSLVLVEGRIQIRSYETNGGQRRWATEVVARNVQFLDRKAEPSKAAASIPAKESENTAADDDFGIEESDLPF